jgi:hypothetical protein
MDLGGIELDSPLNIDKNDFNHMRASAVAHHERGGIITFSWHPMNPLTGGNTWDTQSTEVVASILPGGENHEKFMGWLSKAADFLGSIKDAEGNMNNLRVAKACDLLANTALSASEICYDCGFNNKSNFIRIFTKRKNMTPIEYRNHISQMLIKY